MGPTCKIGGLVGKKNIFFKGFEIIYYVLGKYDPHVAAILNSLNEKYLIDSWTR